jgi:hypothetical protein
VPAIKRSRNQTAGLSINGKAAMPAPDSSRPDKMQPRTDRRMNRGANKPAKRTPKKWVLAFKPMKVGDRPASCSQRDASGHSRPKPNAQQQQQRQRKKRAREGRVDWVMYQVFVFLGRVGEGFAEPTIEREWWVSQSLHPPYNDLIPATRHPLRRFRLRSSRLVFEDLHFDEVE